MDRSIENDRQSRQEPSFSFGYLKYIVIAALVVFVIFIFVYNSGSNKPFSEVSQAVESHIDASVLSKEDSLTFKKDYDLNASDFPGVMLYDSPSHFDAQEILLVEVEDDAQMQEVEDAIDRHIESRLSDFENYIPEQELLLKEAVVTVRGNYIFMAVSEDAEEYQRAFLKAL